MSYLLDKKIKRKKLYQIISLIFVFLVLFYFRTGLFSSLSSISHKFFTPVLTIGNNIGGRLGSVGAYFSSKSSLYSENETLRSELEKSRGEMLNYDSVLAENISLKETLGRKPQNSTMVLASILAKPNQSAYDTLVIDAGREHGLQEGDVVFALGNVPVGWVDVVYDNSSKVILFSNSGKKTQVVITPSLNSPSPEGLSLGLGPKLRSGVREGSIFMEVVGRGGGNFEMVIPRDFVLLKGDQVVLPGIVPRVLGIVEKIISDPRDSLQKALLVSPVNIQEIKFVEVEI